MKALLAGARSATPYLLVEVLLPGGTMIALLMWIFRHRGELAAKGNALRAQGRRLMGRITRPIASSSS
jgi:hypothetical protein